MLHKSYFSIVNWVGYWCCVLLGPQIWARQSGRWVLALGSGCAPGCCWHGSWVCFFSPCSRVWEIKVLTEPVNLAQFGGCGCRCGLNHLFTATAKFCLVVYLSLFCLLGAVCFFVCLIQVCLLFSIIFCLFFSLLLSLYFFVFLLLVFMLFSSPVFHQLWHKKKRMLYNVSLFFSNNYSFNQLQRIINQSTWGNIINTATGLYQCIKPSVKGGALFMWEWCIKSNIL